MKMSEKANPITPKGDNLNQGGCGVLPPSGGGTNTHGNGMGSGIVPPRQPTPPPSGNPSNLGCVGAANPLPPSGGGTRTHGSGMGPGIVPPHQPAPPSGGPSSLGCIGAANPLTPSGGGTSSNVRGGCALGQLPQRFVVEGAKVRCSEMPAGDSASKMISSGGGGPTMNGAVELTHEDIKFYPHFSDCEGEADKCDPCIDENQWFGFDGNNLIDDKYALLTEDAFMICEKGGGVLYITNDGQTPASRNIASLLAQLLLGRCLVCIFGGDPVNMSTGNFIYEHTDLKIGGAVPLSFERFYNIQSDYVGVFSKGWVHNYEVKIIPELFYGGVRILFEDGRQEHYWEDETGEYVSPQGVYATLTRTKIHDFQPIESRGYLLQYPDQSFISFDKDGKMISRSDSNGNEITFTYDGDLLVKVSSISGELHLVYEEKALYTIVLGTQPERKAIGESKLVAVRDHTGREIHFEYEKYAFNTYVLSSYADTKGNKYHYYYDELERLHRLINRDGVCLVNSEFDIQDRVVKQYSSDGGVWNYEYSENGETTLTERDGSKTTYMRDRLYRTRAVKHPRGYEHFFYNDENQKYKIVDKKNNKTQFEYDQQGNLTTIHTPLEITTELEYTKDCKLESVTVDGQKKAQLEYDDNGDLSAVEDAIGRRATITYATKAVPETIHLPDGSKIQLFYDKYRNITKVINGAGMVREYQYDALHRLAKEVDGDGNETSYQYDTEGNVTQITNALGNTRTYIYNSRSLVTSLIDYDGSVQKWEYGHLRKPTKLIDSLGRETKLSYNLMWLLEEIEEPNGAITKVSYDKESNIKTIEKPDEATLQFEYDPNGNRTSLINEEGHQVKLVYDALNRLIEVNGEEGLSIRYTYNAEGQVTSVTDALENTVYLTYDEAGQLIEEKNPLGEVRSYTYAPLGEIASVTDEAGRETVYVYREGGQLEKICHPDGRAEIYTYDNNGNIKTKTDRMGNVEEYTYDALNRITKIEKRYQGEISLDGATSSSKEFSYDPVGNILSMTDEEGFVTTYEYTLTRKLSKVTDPLGNETRYGYDECDRLIEVRQVEKNTSTESVIDVSDNNLLDINVDFEQAVKMNKEGAGIRITRYQRNLLGQVEKVTDALGQTEEFYYDGKGQLIEQIDKEGYLTRYSYTAHGDVSYIQYDDGREVRMSYDPLQQLKQVEDWLGATRINYDPLGRVTQVTDHNQRTVKYSWGVGGVRTGITYPDGKEVRYQYDELLRLGKVIDGEREVNYFYDEFSRLTQKQYPNRMFTKYDYDPASKLRWFSHETPEKPLDTYAFLYDVRGNKIGVEKNRAGLPEESRKKGWYGYRYDELNRLSEVHRSGERIKTYSYDGYGNRTQLEENLHEGPSKTTHYSYNALNQLIFTEDNKENRTDYSYDRRGNLSEVYNNNQLTLQYHFNPMNQLEKVFNHEKQLGATYRYNGLGRRIGKTEGSVVGQNLPSMLEDPKKLLDDIRLYSTKEVDDVLDLTKQYHNLLQRRQNQEITSYVWDRNVLALQEGKGSYQSYLNDELGSPIRLLCDSGLETGLYGYDEFGNDLLPELESHRNTHQPFTYTGYQSCTVTSDLYAQAREYSPENGRFISHDKYWNPENMIYGDDVVFTENPIQLKNLLPDLLVINQSGNPYGYTVNNPLKYTDPTGLECTCDIDYFGDGITWEKILAEVIKKATTYGIDAAGEAITQHIPRIIGISGQMFSIRFGQIVTKGGNSLGGGFAAVGGISHFNQLMEDKDMFAVEAAIRAGGRAYFGWYAAKKAGLGGAALGAMSGPFAPVLTPVLGIGFGVAGGLGATWAYDWVFDNVNTQQDSVPWRIRGNPTRLINRLAN